MKSFARSFLFAVIALSGLGGCQSQGEGEHCDQLNGSNDCSSGLECSNASVCCVPGTAACNAPLTGTAGSGGSSSTDAATGDATAETSSSEAAPSEAASNEAAANDSAKTEASATGSETSVDSGPANSDASDAAAE